MKQEFLRRLGETRGFSRVYGRFSFLFFSFPFLSCLLSSALFCSSRQNRERNTHGRCFYFFWCLTFYFVFVLLFFLSIYFIFCLFFFFLDSKRQILVVYEGVFGCWNGVALCSISRTEATATFG